MHMAVPPFMPDELPNLPAALRDEISGIVSSRLVQLLAHGTDHIPCAWFDMATRKCRHYEHRPEVCVEFAVGSADCNEHRKSAGMPAAIEV